MKPICMIFGNSIPNLAIIWEATGGVIDQQGRFTAGDSAGSYQVDASASSDSIQRTGTAMIPIPPLLIVAGETVQKRTKATSSLLQVSGWR